MVMAPSGFEDFVSVETLFTNALLRLELFDWCAIQQTCQLCSSCVSSASPILRSAKASIIQRGSKHDDIFRCCEAGDVTGLWSLNEDGGVLIYPSGVRKNASRGDTLLHAVVRAAGESWLMGGKTDFHRLFCWLMSLPGANMVVNARNLRGQTPLHLCARYGCEVEARCFLSLQHLTFDVRDAYESTPLVDAVREERPGMTKLLLEHGADVNTFVPNCHGHGDTPLMLAVRLKNIQITRLLLGAKGINLHQKSLLGVSFGQEALDFAPSCGPLRELLQQALDASECSEPDPEQDSCDEDTNTAPVDMHFESHAEVSHVKEHVKPGARNRQGELLSMLAGSVLGICGLTG